MKEDPTERRLLELYAEDRQLRERQEAIGHELGALSGKRLAEQRRAKRRGDAVRTGGAVAVTGGALYLAYRLAQWLGR